MNDRTAQRVKDTGDDWSPTAFPVEFSVPGYRGLGVPVGRPFRALGLSCCQRCWASIQTQESTLGLIFHWADRQGLPLLDLRISIGDHPI